jgi:hypothetical protein
MIMGIAMSHNNENLKSEIEYIKVMASDGDKKPVPFAKIIFLAGLAWIFYNFLKHLLFYKYTIYSRPHIDNINFGKVYNPYFNPIIDSAQSNLHYIIFFAFVAIVFIFRKYFFGVGQKSTANQTILSVWSGVFIFIITRDLSHYLMLDNPDFFNQVSKHWGGIRPERWIDPKELYIGLLSIEFNYTQVTRLISIFSLAWWISADMTKYKWLKLFAIVGFFSFPLMEKYKSVIIFTPLNSVNFAIIFFLILPAALMLFFEKKN